MKAGTALFIVALVCLGGAASGSAADQAQDRLLDRLLEISSVAEFAWSPAGDRIAYVTNTTGTNQIHLLDLQSMGSRQLSRQPSAVTDPRWSPGGDSLLFLTDPGFQERYGVWRVNLSGGEAPLMHDVGAIQRHVRFSPDGSRVVLETNMAGNFDIAVRALNNPVLRALASQDSDEENPEWAPDGGSVVFVSGRSLWSVPADGGEARRLVTPGLGAAVADPRWSPDGRHLLFRTDQSGFWNLAVYSVADETWRYLAPEPLEQSEPSWSPDGQQIAFVSTRGFDKRVAVATLKDGDVRILTEEGTVASSPRWKPGGGALAFLMSSPQRTRELWLHEGGRLRRLTDSMAGWEESEFPIPEAHTYRSAEGLEVPGLLYKPAEIEPGVRYPALIVIHGGFYGQWVNDFRLLGQYFLDRGMVLFYPNPRGGGGYGRMYERLNDGDWGGGDLNDLTRAHDYLKTLPYVDGDHVGIWGGSYGGYLTYALVTTAPERFQAAVVRAGINDLRAQVLERKYSPGRLNDINSYVRQIGGLPDENPDFYQARSPLTWVQKVKTPMLILHGLRDNRVSPNQSRNWVAALEQNDVPVVYAEYPQDDHSLRRHRSTVRDQLARMAALFEKHLALPPESGERSPTDR